jgi:ubiquinone/menaquinone biosynthesis C-methylase UbiE
MSWTAAELEQLSPIFQQILDDLPHQPSAQVLMLCSGRGQITFWLAELLPTTSFTGLELDRGALEAARREVSQRNLERVEFYEAEFSQIPYPDASFDAIVSDFILFPTPSLTQIGQTEMARVLRPGGRLILTDVLLAMPIPHLLRNELHAIGMNYLCETSPEQMRDWIEAAGLIQTNEYDFTNLLQRIWRARRAADIYLRGSIGYSLLLDNPAYCLGCAIHYLYMSASKP